MPHSKENKIKSSSFMTEFADYVEKLSCLNCRLIIVGDVRSLRRIDKDALSAGLSAICVNHECSNFDIIVSQYSSFMVV